MPDPTQPLDYGMPPPVTSLQPPDDLGILPPGTTLHTPDQGSGITHVQTPAGAVVPVATSVLKPADHKMLASSHPVLSDADFNAPVPDGATVVSNVANDPQATQMIDLNETPKVDPAPNGIHGPDAWGRPRRDALWGIDPATVTNDKLTSPDAVSVKEPVLADTAPAPATSGPSTEEIEQAKLTSPTVLGRLVRTTDDPKSGTKIVTMLGSDGGVHDYDWNKLPEALQSNLMSKAGPMFGRDAPDGSSSTLGGMARAVAHGAGYDAPGYGLGLDPTKGQQAAIDHPLLTKYLGGAIRGLERLTPTEQLFGGPLGVAEAMRRGADGNRSFAGGGVPSIAAPAAVPDAAKDAEIPPKQNIVGAPSSVETPSPTAASTPPPIGTGVDEKGLAADQAKIAGATDDQQTALAAQAKAQGEQSQALGKELGSAADAATAHEKAMGDAYGELNKAYRQRFDAMKAVATDLFKSAVVDPNRLWSKANTAQRISGAIGLVLSTVGAGINHTQPVNLIQHAIDNDIEAQKDSFRNKAHAANAMDTAYGSLVQKGMNGVEAEHVLRITGLETAKTRVSAIAQQTNSPIIKAQADQQIAALDKAQVQENMALKAGYDRSAIEQAQAKRLNLGNQQAMQPQAEPVNPQNVLKVKGRTIVIPGAKADPEATQLRTQVAAAESVMGDLDEMAKAENQTGSWWGYGKPGTEIAAKKIAIITKIRAALGGRDDPETRSMIKNMDHAFDPSFWKSSAAYQAGVDAFKRSIMKELDDRFKAKGLPAYSSIQSPDQQRLNSAVQAGNFTPAP